MRIYSGTKESIGLCKKHYNCMYTCINPKEPCASCGAKRRERIEKDFRYCPSPYIINDYLNTVSNEPITLTSRSIICLSCYKYFQSIIADPSNHPIMDVNDVIASLSECIDTLRGGGKEIEKEDFYELMMCLCAKTLGSKMKADEAMLLPTLYHTFIELVSSEAPNFPSIQPMVENSIPGKRWVLSKLNSYFGYMLTVTCKVDCYGTLLFHKNCDLLKALSAALANDTRKSHAPKPKESENLCASSMKDHMHTVSLYLNEKLHDQAKTLVAAFKNKPLRYSTFSITSYMAMLDPELLGFVQEITSSVRGRRKLFRESDVNHIKLVRQLFLISSLLYCTNSQCCMPFQMLLTEAIQCNGGTLELIKIMNRVGVAASIDTNHRLATQVVQSRLAHGILSDINMHALSMVSIDNIDILQPHAFVSCTDATRMERLYNVFSRFQSVQYWKKQRRFQH